jgi:hypothetical protein
MNDRTITQSIETETEPETIFDLLADPRNIPKWAPLFADEVSGDGKRGWLVTKDGKSFVLHVASSPSSGTVDYLREIAPGRVGGAYIRVLPRPGTGSTIVMTLPITPGITEEKVATILRGELAQLVQMSLQSH